MKKTVICSWLSLLLVLTLISDSGILKAQEKAKEQTDEDAKVNPELQAKIKELIKKLGDDKWENRENATESLIELSKTSCLAVARELENALPSINDAEIRWRAESILSEILSLDFLLARNGMKVRPPDDRGITYENFLFHLVSNKIEHGKVDVSELSDISDPKGLIKDDKRPVVEMRCEAYKDSCITITPKLIPKSKEFTLKDKPVLDVWIYPTKTGDTCGEYGCATLSVSLHNSKSNEIISLGYTWSGYNHWKEKKTNISKVENGITISNCLFDWEPNEWHELKIDFLEEITKTNAYEIKNPDEWQLQEISTTCHYSNGDPGTFFVDSPKIIPAQNK
jgi:hypothetical protein